MRVFPLLFILAVLLLCIFGGMFLIQAIKVMKNVEKMTDKTDSMLETLDEYLKMPLHFIQGMAEKFKHRKDSRTEEDKE